MLLQATLALSLVVSSLKSVGCDFSIFSAVMKPIACPLFNLVRNSVVHSPSAMTRRVHCARGVGSGACNACAIALLCRRRGRCNQAARWRSVDQPGGDARRFGCGEAAGSCEELVSSLPVIVNRCREWRREADAMSEFTA